ncbi:hypothetical protein FHX42_001975 [Saccharopolyspora lacisalsi]|uniref:Uncharacterized protein n=1 Tax=Halosaccharopolyspora lacisalsi TaxID=1000566 RepID=A0A839E0X7_9PSEU|nr:hypothetical protein [Halosaccharopolyspora lacisalsi]MBA8824628.1 hypothetical protein [Halosaccharopolyspora lacisalsi]
MSSTHSPLVAAGYEVASTTPSSEGCQVCGHFALTEDTSHEFAHRPINRLICQVCGAHRVTNV